MSDIQFEEETVLPSHRQPEKKKPHLVSLLLSTGVVKNEKQAGYLLVGFVIFGILLAVVIFWNLISPSSDTPEIPPEVLRQMNA